MSRIAIAIAVAVAACVVLATPERPLLHVIAAALVLALMVLLWRVFRCGRPIPPIDAGATP